MPLRLTRRAALAGLAAGLLLPSIGWAQSASKTVLILVRRANPTDQAIVDGFKKGLPDGTVVTFELGDDVDEAAAALATEMRGFPVDLVFCIGDTAALAAVREFSTVPLVVANLTRPVTAAGAPVAEVPGRVDPASVASLAVAMRGKAVRVGVLRASMAGPEYWTEVEKIFAAKGVALTMSPFIEVKTGISTRAEALAHQCDLLWVDQSPLVGNAEFSAIARFAHGLKVGVIGFDRAQFDLPDSADLILQASPEGVGAAASVHARKLFGQPAGEASAYPTASWVGSRIGVRNLAIPLSKDFTGMVGEWR